LQGIGTIACRFKSIPLLPQSYTLKMAIREQDARNMIIDYQDVAYFSVVGDLAAFGFKGDYLSHSVRSTAVIIPYEWRMPDGAVAAIGLNHLPK
jgi:hypothetical protein